MNVLFGSRGRSILSPAAPALLALLISGFADSGRGDPFSWPGAAPHENISCQTCHALVAETEADASEGEDPGRTCRSCHDGQADPESVNFFHRDPSASCVRCHSFHDPGTFSAMGRRNSVGAGGGRAWDHCRTCHPTDGSTVAVSDGHRAAAEVFYHARVSALERMSLSEGCMVCHSSAASNGPTLPQGVVTPRFSGHASHRYGIRLVRGQKIGTGTIRNTVDPRIPLFEGKIECQTCHDITQPTVDHLIPFDPPYAMCETCHVLHPGADREQGTNDVAALTP